MSAELTFRSLTRKVACFLPDHLKTHCKVAQFNKGQLILSIADPIFATELRYLLPKLRDQLRIEGRLYQLSSIKLTVQIEQFDIRLPKFQIHRKLSPESKNCILEAAAKCQYPALKEILIKIASPVLDCEICHSREGGKPS